MKSHFLSDLSPQVAPLTLPNIRTTALLIDTNHNIFKFVGSFAHPYFISYEEVI